MKRKEKLTNRRNKHNTTLKGQTDRDEDISEDTGKGMGTETETMLKPNNALLTSWHHQTHQYITWSINHVNNNVIPNSQMLLHDWYGLSKNRHDEDKYFGQGESFYFAKQCGFFFFFLRISLSPSVRVSVCQIILPCVYRADARYSICQYVCMVWFVKGPTITKKTKNIQCCSDAIHCISRYIMLKMKETCKRIISSCH